MEPRRTSLLGISLVVAGFFGFAGFEFGQSRSSAHDRADAAQQQAYDAAYAAAIGPAEAAGRKRGVADGREKGKRDGAVAGAEAARLATSGTGGGSSVVVWATGDGADGGAAGQRVAQVIGAGQVDRFLYLGDVYEGRSLGEFVEKYDKTYGILNGVASPTPGNHEWGDREAGYNPYWGAVTGQAQPPWYSFDLGGWQFLSLNSEADHAPGSEQVAFAEDQIAGQPQFGTCRIAYWHRPFLSGGLHGGQQDMAPLWDAVRGKAAIVIAGHDHDMQRFEPVDGTTEFVAGAGGHEHYPVKATPGLVWSDDDTYGALRLTLKQKKADYAFVSERGQVIPGSTGTLSCKRG